MSGAPLDRETERPARVLLVRRGRLERPAKKAKAVDHLGNPVTELYREVTNLQATWVDAVFWFVLGVLGNALGEMIWDYVKQML